MEVHSGVTEGLQLGNGLELQGFSANLHLTQRKIKSLITENLKIESVGVRVIAGS